MMTPLSGKGLAFCVLKERARKAVKPRDPPAKIAGGSLFRLKNLKQTSKMHQEIFALRRHLRANPRVLFFRIISNLVETNMDFLSEKFLLSAGSANGESHGLPGGPMPGQKSIRLAKKGGGSSFPNAGFRRFSPVIPLPPRLFAEARKGEFRKFLPPLSGFGACFFPRATKKRV